MGRRKLEMSDEESEVFLGKELIPRNKTPVSSIHIGVKETDEPFIIQCIREDYTITDIAKELGCSRGTLDKYVKSHPHLLAEVVDSRGSLVDEAEKSLRDNVKNGDQKAVEYVLNNLGKDRGFGEVRAIPQTQIPQIIIGRIDINTTKPVVVEGEEVNE